MGRCFPGKTENTLIVGQKEAMEQVGLNWGEEAEGRVEKGVQGVTHPLKTF